MIVIEAWGLGQNSAGVSGGRATELNQSRIQSTEQQEQQPKNF